MKIKAKKVDGGYIMICTGKKTEEEPQEGKLHKTRHSVYADARIMYHSQAWDWRERNKTIKID
mgnify:FL=1